VDSQSALDPVAVLGFGDIDWRVMQRGLVCIQVEDLVSQWIDELREMKKVEREGVNG